MVDKWSHADQALLEEAIVLYSAESCPDVKNRWTAISKHVGRPVKDCVARVIARAKECGPEAGKSAQGEKEAVEKEKQRKAQEAREKERKDDEAIEEELRRKREQAEKDRVETLRKLKESEERERQERERKEKERKDLADQQERDRLKRSEEADKRIALAQRQQQEAEQRRQQEMMGKAHYAKAAKRNEIERKKKEKEDRLAQAAREAMGAISLAEHKVVDAEELRKNDKAKAYNDYAKASSSTRKSKSTSGSSENICPLCAEPRDLWMVGQCGHRSMCANCGLRMRLLLDNKRCMECQVEIEDFVCTPDRECPFSDFGICERIATGRPHVYFVESVEGFVEGEENAEDIRYLQSYRKCPLKCSYWGPDNFKALEKHVWNEHYMEFCRFCLEFKKDFIQNQVAYSENDLKAHIRVGDDVVAKGHPQCSFCKKRFYSDTEYGKHLREAHFWCHICEKNGRRDVFFGSHPALYKHFESHHYVCYQPECKAESWVVFGTQADLDAHHVDKHDPKQVGALLNFSFRTPNSGGRSGPSREAPQQTQGIAMHPPPMAPVLSRDEEFPSLAGGGSAPSSAGPGPKLGSRPPMAKAVTAASKAKHGGPHGRGKAPAGFVRDEDFPTLGGKASFSPPSRQNINQSSASATGTGMFAKIAAGANRNEQIAAAKAKTQNVVGKAPAKSTFSPAVDDFPSLPKPSRKVGHKPKGWATTPGPAPVSSSSAAPKSAIEAIPKAKMSQKAKKKLELRSLAFNK